MKFLSHSKSDIQKTLTTYLYPPSFMFSLVKLSQNTLIIELIHSVPITRSWCSKERADDENEYRSED